MKRLALLIAVSSTLNASSAMALEVAFSFENAPNPPTPLLGADRTMTLVSSLHAAGVEQAIFFALGKNIESQGTKNLSKYASAGHVLGSQGYAMKTVDELGSTAFVRDMKRNDLLVKDLPGFKMWFRFPYLNQGSTVEARDTVRVWIYHMLYGRAQVTIDTPDEALDRLVQDGLNAGRHLNIEKMRRLYVDVMMDCVRHYDQMSIQVLGYSAKHIMRFHDNDLAALFIGDFIAELNRSGGRVIKAVDALTDDLNTHEANVIPIVGSQIIAVAQERGIVDVAHANIEDPALLQDAFIRANVWDLERAPSTDEK